MSERPSLPRWIALVLIKHAAWVLPPARGPWAKAMQNELPRIESDLEALSWAGGCLVASYLEKGRAMTRRQIDIGLAALIFLAAVGAASWWIGQRPYLTPGNHEVFREDSNLGAVAGFLVFIVAAIPCIVALFALHDRRFGDAARAGRICAFIMVPYLAALILVSLLTPRTVVNIGDSYCYDLWCLGVNQVNATPSGQNLLYEVRITAFVDSSHTHRLPAEQAKSFFYALDGNGHRYALLPESFSDAGVTLQPGESVKSSFAFVAPANASKLYLIGNAGDVFLPWVYLYFGSDVSLFHRSALLRIL